MVPTFVSEAVKCGLDRTFLMEITANSIEEISVRDLRDDSHPEKTIGHPRKFNGILPLPLSKMVSVNTIARFMRQ